MIVNVPVDPAVTVAELGVATTVKSGPVTLYVTVAEWDREPLVPVTVTVKVPTGPEQERLEVWEPPRRRLVGDILHARPLGETDDARVTVPVNPLTGETVIVEMPVSPGLTATLVGFAVTEKSVLDTTYATVVEWEREPLAPVIVTVNEPLDDALHDKFEVPEPEILAGDSLHVRPAEGDTEEDRVTALLNPLTEETVIVDEPLPPTFRATLVGLAPILKSVMVKVTVVEWEREPLVPVTVTVYVPAGPLQDRVEV